jgi:hypothetical protein
MSLKSYQFSEFLILYFLFHTINRRNKQLQNSDNKMSQRTDSTYQKLNFRSKLTLQHHLENILV